MQIPGQEQNECQGNNTDHVGQWIGEALSATPALPVGASLMSGGHGMVLLFTLRSVTPCYVVRQCISGKYAYNMHNERV
jgi:hypothetical protein